MCAWFDFCTLPSGRKVSFVSYGQSTTCLQASEGHSRSLAFQLPFTTQLSALLNNGKNVIWLLFKARRYHSLRQQWLQTGTRGLGGHKESHSECCSISSGMHASTKHTHTQRPEEDLRRTEARLAPAEYRPSTPPHSTAEEP